MLKFDYAARDRAGKLIKGFEEAQSRFDAISQLKHKGLTVIYLSKVVSDKAKKKAASQAKKKKKLFDINRVSLTDLAVFARQLSVSINAGMTAIDALRSISEDMDNPHFKEILDEVVNDVNSGSSLSEAIGKHGKTFGTLFIALIRSAEESGSMPRILDYLAGYLEKSVALSIKIRTITAYPIFVAGFFVIVLLIMTLFILPKFADIFTGFDAELPALTQMVFDINRFSIRNFPIFFILGVVSCVGIFMYNRTPKGRFNIDKFKLKLPFIGKLLQKIAVARFCQVLAVMVRGGVPIGISLDVASDVCDNKVIEKSIKQVKEQVMNGSDIAGALGRDKIFPRFVVRMFSIGESSGRLDEVLDKITKMYEDQIEGSIMIATSMFEPVVITIFGIFVMIILLAIYIPIFKFASSVR